MFSETRYSVLFIGLLLRVSEYFFYIFFYLCSREHNLVVASLTENFKVHANAVHLENSASAWVWLFHLKSVAHFNIHKLSPVNI